MLIGITGYAGSGKNETAEIIKDLCCYPVQVTSFAKEIKYLFKEWLNWSDDHLESVMKNYPLPITPDTRKLAMIFYRKYYKNPLVTIDKVLEATSKLSLFLENEGRFVNSEGKEVIICSPRRLLQFFGTDCVRDIIGEEFWTSIVPNSDVVFADVRFENEASFIRNNNGTVIHLKRFKDTDDNHISEQPVDVKENDIVLENYGSIEDLKRKVSLLMEDL